MNLSIEVGLLKIFMTGMPGVGKTTVVCKVTAILRERGLKPGGVYCPEIRVNNVRVGFEIMDILTGARGILAHVSSDDGGPMVGRYRVNLQNLSSIGVEALRRAVVEADFIVIDEVGPMELQGEDFQEVVLAVVEGDKPVLGIIHWRTSHPVIDMIKAKEDVRIVEVTPENREALPSMIAEEILETI